jgi:flagellar biosynthesis/type III secretory pathway chaperone
MTALETDLLAELIRRKLDCLVELREMGEKQLELVAEDRITDLLDVLSAKQRFLMELQRIERAMDPFRGQKPEQRRWRTPESRKDCARQIEECERLLAQIVVQEKQAEGELIRRRDAVAQRLQGVHSASQARGAYSDHLQPGASQLDLLSER